MKGIYPSSHLQGHLQNQLSESKEVRKRNQDTLLRVSQLWDEEKETVAFSYLSTCEHSPDTERQGGAQRCGSSPQNTFLAG